MIDTNKPIQATTEKYDTAYWFARIVSNVFHPFFIPFCCALILFMYAPTRYAEYDNHARIGVLGLLAAITIIYPGLAIVIMKKLGMITTIRLRDRKDRIIPYVVILTFYVWLCYMILKQSNNMSLFPNEPIFGRMIVSITAAISIAFVFNNFLKVSMHMLAQGGLLSFLVCFAPYADYPIHFLFIFAILIAGCVGTARLILHAHTIAEIAIGFFIACFATYIVWIILPHWGILS